MKWKSGTRMLHLRNEMECLWTNQQGWTLVKLCKFPPLRCRFKSTDENKMTSRWHLKFARPFHKDTSQPMKLRSLLAESPVCKVPPQKCKSANETKISPCWCLQFARSLPKDVSQPMKLRSLLADVSSVRGPSPQDVSQPMKLRSFPANVSSLWGPSLKM